MTGLIPPEMTVIGQLSRASGPAGWPALCKAMLYKALRRPAKITLELAGHRWVYMTHKPSGLKFFYEVVILESYGVIRDDLVKMSSPLVIDGGANCGAFALWALSVNPAARVISFEPGEAFENLALNRDVNMDRHHDRWQVMKCALSSKIGMGHFTQDANSSMGHLDENGAEKADDDGLVQIRTVDDLGLTPEVLKIDVEGHEAEVLKGSEKALNTAKLVVLEYHSPELRQQCIEILSANGFVLQEKKELIVGRK